MTENSRLLAAVTAGVLGSEREHRALLQSIVEVARAIFGAKASSIFLLDEETDELVFEAVAGEGEGDLVGMRIPSGQGIAGWVLVTRQPLVIDDLSNDPRHARSVAESTGYVPKALMSVPLLHEDLVLGVLQVLDRRDAEHSSLAEIDLLGAFANQAAIALLLLQRARRANAVLDESGGEAGIVARVAEALDAVDDEVERAAALRLLEGLAKLLEARGSL